MKLTLFTISNEQIKEQLGKLQTKVESLENTKELQDKVISMQDHQISFLNDSIANMWAPIGIVAGLAGLIITGAFAYVTFLNGNAQKKIKQAAEIIEQSKSIAVIAQEKIDELLEKQAELNELTSSLSINQKGDMTLKNIKIKLDFIENALIMLFSEINKTYSYSNENEEHYERYNELKQENRDLKTSYTHYSFLFNTKIINEEVITLDDVTSITNLEDKCTVLRQEINDYHEFYSENN